MRVGGRKRRRTTGSSKKSCYERSWARDIIHLEDAPISRALHDVR